MRTLTTSRLTKITTGELRTFYVVGHAVGGRAHVYLDGTNHNITIWDNQSDPGLIAAGGTGQRLRVWLGKFESETASTMASRSGTSLANSCGIFRAAPRNCGIENAAITTAKIRDAPITSAKIGTAEIQSANIGNLAVKTAHIDELTVGTSKIADNAVTVSIIFATNTANIATVTEKVAATLVIPVLAPNEQVFLLASGMGTVPPDRSTNNMWIRLREDNLTGAERSTTALGHGMQAPIFIQFVYTNDTGTTLFGKQFVVTFHNLSGSASIQMDFMRFTGLVRKK